RVSGRPAGPPFVVARFVCSSVPPIARGRTLSAMLNVAGGRCSGRRPPFRRDPRLPGEDGEGVRIERMNLSLTKRADYTVRAALCLAGRWESGELVTVATVARQMSLPRTYTPQILGLLTGAGLAEARPGRGGGYRLSRTPSEIAILDVVEAGDGRVGSSRCI